MRMEETSTLYGMVAEFETPEQLLHAANSAREAGYKEMDAYSPHPVHGLADALGFVDNRIPWIVFFGGIAGAVAGMGLQVFVHVVDYPMNVGGRPLFSWPNFIPITFELTILLASFGAFFGMLALNGFPRPYHPIFNARRFERASQDRFFLCIEAADARFDPVETREFLAGLGADAVSPVRSDRQYTNDDETETTAHER